jgi:hypothetical protein
VLVEHGEKSSFFSSEKRWRDALFAKLYRDVYRASKDGDRNHGDGAYTDSRNTLVEPDVLVTNMFLKSMYTSAS